MKKNVQFSSGFQKFLATASLLWALIIASMGYGQSVTGLTLINADTDQHLYSLTSGVVANYINYATLPTQNLNIEATTTGTTGSVVFVLNGSVFRIVNAAPYALAGNLDEDYLPWTPDAGTHTLTVTPYSQPGGQGTAGATRSITINVVGAGPGRRSFEEKGENTLSTVTAYPVPLQDKLIIDFASQPGGVRSVMICDLTGRVFYRKLVREDLRRVQIDLTALGMTTGLYLLQIQSSAEHKVIKLVKELR